MRGGSPGEARDAAQIPDLASHGVEGGVLQAVIVRERELDLVLPTPLNNQRNGLVRDLRQRPDGLLDEVAQTIREARHQNQEERDRQPLAPALDEVQLAEGQVGEERHQQGRRQVKAPHQDQRPQHKPIRDAGRLTLGRLHGNDIGHSLAVIPSQGSRGEPFRGRPSGWDRERPRTTRPACPLREARLRKACRKRHTSAVLRGYWRVATVLFRCTSGISLVYLACFALALPPGLQQPCGVTITWVTWVASESCGSWLAYLCFPPWGLSCLVAADYEQDGITICRARLPGGGDGQRLGDPFSYRQSLVRPRQCGARIRPRLHLLQRTGAGTDEDRARAAGNLSGELGRLRAA